MHIYSTCHSIILPPLSIINHCSLLMASHCLTCLYIVGFTISALSPFAKEGEQQFFFYYSKSKSSIDSQNQIFLIFISFYQQFTNLLLALNDMVYDPVLGVWVGNPDALKSFAVHPQLITSKTRPDKSKCT